MCEVLPSEVTGFRETFLLRFRPKDREYLEGLATMLDEMTELAHHWPQPLDSPATQGYDAALADLRYTAQFLQHLSTEPERTDMNAEDIRRCERACTLASELLALLNKADV